MSVEIKKDITTVQVEVPKINVAVENAVTQINVQTSQPSLTISQAGVSGKDGTSGTSGTFGNVLSSSLYISGSIIPNTAVGDLTSSFSLGSATNAWKDLWISKGTIYFIGDNNESASISINVDNQIVISDINLTGSLTASLREGYIWVGGPGNKNIAIPTSSLVTGGTGAGFPYEGEAQITGSLIVTGSIFLNGVNIAGGGIGTNGTSGTSGLTITGSAGSDGTSGTSGLTITGSAGTSGIDGTSGTSGLTITGSAGSHGTSGTSGISVLVDSGSFATTGSNTFIGNQTISGSVYLQNGESILSADKFDSPAGDLTLRAGDSVSSDAGDLTVRAGDTVTGIGGNLIISAGDTTTGNAGTLNISSGETITGNGGNFTINAGQTISGDGGDVSINAGQTVTGAGGDVSIKAGDTVTGAGGHIILTTGDSVNGNPGDITLRIVSASVNKDWVFGSASVIFPDGTTQLTAWVGGGSSNTQQSSFFENIIESGSFLNYGNFTASYQSYGAPSLNFEIGYQLPITTETGIDVLAIAFPDETIQTTAFTGIPQGTVSSSQQITDFGFVSSSTADTTQLNNFTSSIIAEINGIEAYTASLKATTLISGAAQITALGFGAGGGDTSQLGIATASLNSYTSSNDLVRNRILQTTASLNTFTGSIRGEVNGLEAYTASLKAATLISGSGQLSGFATLTANTFVGNQIITGSLIVSSTAVSDATLLTSSSNLILNSGSNLYINNGGSANITGLLTLTGSLNVSGSTLQTGNNTLIGNTVLSGSLEVSGSSNFHNSIFIVTGSSHFTGSHFVDGVSTFSGSIYIASGSSYYRAGNKLFNYGQWCSLETQTGSANTAYAMKFGTQLDGSEGVYVSNNLSNFPTRVYLQNTGMYNIQFSAQLHTTLAEAIDFSIWLSKDGTNITNSNTEYTIERVGGGGYLAATRNFLEPITSGSYIEVLWSATTANGQLLYKAVQSTPTRPETPSCIVTITQVA